VLTPTPVSWTKGYDYTNPSQRTGNVDPTLSVDHTTEVVVSVERQIAPEFAVSASYIWRNYSNARWNDTIDWTSADYVQRTTDPTKDPCPSGARCDAVTYFEPLRPIPTGYVLTNQPDFRRGYQGVEFMARKRMSQGWMLNASFSYNDARVHYDSSRAYEDPTNIENVNNAQYAPQYGADQTSAAVGNAFVNARWIFRASGSYRSRIWGLNLAGFFDSRSGYPFVANIQTPTRANGAGTAIVYLDKLGDNRLPVLRTLDIRVDRECRIRRLRLFPAVEVFNVLNASTPLSIRPTQNATNANQISSILPPRVIRFGLRAEW
jgi:hypothetical protein